LVGHPNYLQYGLPLSAAFVIFISPEPSNSIAKTTRYVLGFSERFVEVWSLETGTLVQVILANHVVHITDNDDDSATIIVSSTSLTNGDQFLHKIHL